MATARIDGILARGANVAVVFRRGPSKWTQLLRWELDTDEVTAGHWIDSRIYTERSDLSPDGRLLLATFMYHPRKHEPKGEASEEAGPDSWTAISRPPYFTVLAEWPAAGTQHGGGIWRGNEEIALDLPPEEEIHGTALPASFKLDRLTDIPWFERLNHRLEASGWRTLQKLEVRPWNAADPEANRTVQEGIMEKPFAGGRLVRTTRSGEETWSALDSAGHAHLVFTAPNQVPQWIDIDHSGRVIYGDTGRLWAWADFPNDKPKFVADLRTNEFEEVEAPAWAREWPSPSA